MRIHSCATPDGFFERFRGAVRQPGFSPVTSGFFEAFSSSYLPLVWRSIAKDMRDRSCDSVRPGPFRGIRAESTTTRSRGHLSHRLLNLQPRVLQVPPGRRDLQGAGFGEYAHPITSKARSEKGLWVDVKLAGEMQFKLLMYPRHESPFIRLGRNQAGRSLNILPINTLRNKDAFLPPGREK